MDGIEDKINALFSSPESMMQIKKLAESLSGAASDTESGSDTGNKSGEVNIPLLSGLDPKLMKLAMNAMKEYNCPSEVSKLISALRPYLRGDRAERLEKAMNIARVARAAKNILPEIGGGMHV